jgi:hypothetical protein
MKRLFLSLAALLAMSVASNAAVIQDFGTDPTSASGAFNHSLGALNGSFDDQYTFVLDQQMTLTIASVTNVFAQPSDKITGFNGSVVFEGADNAIGGGDDVVVIGPVFAGACPLLPASICQGFAGSAVLGPGSYFLDIAGIANGTSGYGGNLATFANETPLPAAAWLFMGGLGLLGLCTGKSKRNQKTAWEMKRA